MINKYDLKVSKGKQNEENKIGIQRSRDIIRSKHKLQ